MRLSLLQQARSDPRAVLTRVQEELRAWRSPRDLLERGRCQGRAFELDLARTTALSMLYDRLGPGYAKRIEIELAEGKPLAMCVGPRKRNLVAHTERGPYRFPTSGCLAVFDDSLATSGTLARMWPRLCPSCRARKVGRDQQRRMQWEITRREQTGIVKGGRPFKELGPL